MSGSRERSELFCNSGVNQMAKLLIKRWQPLGKEIQQQIMLLVG